MRGAMPQAEQGFLKANPRRKEVKGVVQNAQGGQRRQGTERRRGRRMVRGAQSAHGVEGVVVYKS